MEPTETPRARAIYADVQHDWHAQRLESCWLNVYEHEARFCGGETPSVALTSGLNASFQLPLTSPGDAVVRGNARGQEEQGVTTNKTEHLVEITKRERDWMEVRVCNGGIASDRELARVVFQAPRETLDVFAPPRVPSALDEEVEIEAIESRRVVRPQLLSVDVASDERHLVVGGADGKCALWDLAANQPTHPLVGHVLDVTRARFFPSGKVVLTASLDFTLRIWSVDDGRCAAVLKGHRGGVTDVAVVGRGRNVVSSATDGSVHLWCCGNQQIVAAWNNEDASAAHCLALLDDTAHATITSRTFGAQDNQMERADEFETEGKVLFAGLENGKVLGIDLRTRELAVDLRASASVISCAATANGGNPMVITGGEDGVLTTWDLRQPGVPLHVLSRSPAAIHRIVIPNDERGSVWTAQGDGASSNWSHVLRPANVAPFISTEMTGPQYDPVRDLAVTAGTGRVFTACRDGLVREYIPHFLA